MRDHLHGIEIANGRDYSEEAHQIALDHDLVMIGVSDVHNLVDWDYEPHNGGHRPVTLVFAEERSVEAMKAALFAKRTVVWFKNLLIGRPAEVDALLAASLSVSATGWMSNTNVATVTLANASDATLQLQNKTANTFMHSGDLVEVPPHGTVELAVKLASPGEALTLEFDVLNALVAPKTTASISLAAALPERSEGE